MAAAKGMPAAEFPAYRFREPVATWLNGYLDHVPHWTWQDPPEGELRSNDTPPDARISLRVVERSEATAARTPRSA